MNEVENHHSEHAGSGTGQGTGGKTSSGSSNKPADVAKAALDQAQSVASSAKAKASDWATSQYGSASRRVSDVSRRSTQGLHETRDGVQRFIEENPIMVGVVGIAAGLLIGSLLPGTRRENQAFGRYADEVRDQGLRYAKELAEQGKHFVEESLDATAKGGGGQDESETSRPQGSAHG